MRRDHLFSTVLFFAAIASSVASTVAPEYLHLSPSVVPAVFWGFVALALILVFGAIFISVRAEVKTEPEEKMTVADIGYNAALVGGAATVVGAVLKSRRTAIIACMIAWAGIGIDYWWGPPRAFLWSKPPTILSAFGFKGEPFGWTQPVLDNTIYVPPGKPFNIFEINVVGANVSDKEVKLDDVYFLSGIDGTRIDAKISWAGNAYKVQEIRPVPAGAMLIASASFGKPGIGLSPDEFLRQWAIITFVVVQNGVPQRTTFDKEQVKSMFPKPMEPFPHISPIKPDAPR